MGHYNFNNSDDKAVITKKIIIINQKGGPNLFDWFNFRYVKLQHVLDSVLQSDDGTGTAGAGALQLQLNDAVVKSPVQNVASVLLHRWPAEWEHPFIATNHRIVVPKSIFRTGYLIRVSSSSLIIATTSSSSSDAAVKNKTESDYYLAPGKHLILQA